MHTRRVGAFLIGAWLLGALITAYIAAQSYSNVDRFFSNPPPQVAKELEDIGQDVMTQILRFQASQHNRHVFETWEVMQLGILGALLATSFLTSHRSRIVIISTALMLVLVLIAYFQLTPVMNALARSYDFLPLWAALRERDNYNFYSVWYRVLDILKVILAILITGRLLFDRYDWQEKFAPSPAGSPTKRRRRSRRGSEPSATHGAESTTEVSSSDSVEPD